MAELYRGAPVAAALVERVHGRSEALRAAGVAPTLAVVRVGAREDDLSYERGLLKRCAAAGVEARVHELPVDCAQGELEGLLARLGSDAAVHGILLFRPLPAYLDEVSACAAIAPEKDVDCATDASLLATLAGRPGGFAPCTAQAVIEVLDHYGVALDGANVCVVGRSLVVGKPVSLMLQARNATVTMCHTHTADLAGACRTADVLVVAAGRAGVIGAEAVRAGQVVVDVGINWDEGQGRLVGDVDQRAVEPIVSALTPVPGGVGAVTTAVLALHVVEAAERSSACS